MEADFAVEARYKTQTVTHAYLEPDSGVAFIHDNGQLVVLAESQNIHAHQKTIAGAIGLSIEQVRVIQPTMEDNGVSGYDPMKSKGLPTLYKAVNRLETTKLDPGDGHGIPWETFSTIILRSSSKGICGEGNV